MIEEYVTHFAAGLMFAGTGRYVYRWCEHRGWRGFGHRWLVPIGIVAAETAVIVPLVG